jgi:small subunit ribosomal protein S1
VEITPGVEGLIHVSEVSRKLATVNSRDFFRAGDDIQAVVISIARSERKLALGLKELQPDSWTDIHKKYPIGSTQSGTVCNIVTYGIFVRLIEGVVGLIHVSNLSLPKSIKSLYQFTKVGNEIDVVILDIDESQKRLSFKYRNNPWNRYEKNFSVDAIYKGCIKSRRGSRTLVKLVNGPETYVPSRFLKKHDGSLPKIGEILEFKVIFFDKRLKKIHLSHTVTYQLP